MHGVMVLELDELKEVDSLVFTRIDLHNIVGFDLGVFLDYTNENLFNTLRGNKNWLSQLTGNLKSIQQYGVEFPTFATSAYANTDRGERSTFSVYYDNNLMPLSFPITNESLILPENIDVKFISIKIGINGAVTINSKLEYAGAGISCSKFVEVYNQDLHRIRNKAYEIAKKLIKLLTLQMPFHLSFKDVKYEDYLQFIHCFDIIDFDYSAYNLPTKDIQLLCEDENVLKQLVRLFRMSHNNYKNTDMQKVRKFLNDNIGYRKDELWLINENRVIRHYPDALTDSYKICFFGDVILACEILIQYKVSLLYLNQWVVAKCSKVKETINSNRNFASKNIGKIKDIVFEMINFINVFSDDFYVQMNINHSFFNEVIERIISKLGLMKLLDSNRLLLSNLFEQLSSVTAILTTDSSIILDQENLELSRSVEKMNKTVKRLTWFMLIIALIQFFPQVRAFLLTLWGKP